MKTIKKSGETLASISPLGILCFAYFACFAVNLHAQTTLSGDHVITGDLDVGTTGTPGNLKVTGTTALQGNVGVGIMAPSVKLHVLSEGGDQYTLRAENDNSIGSSIQLSSIASGGRNIGLYSLADGAGQGGGRFVLFDETANLVTSDVLYATLLAVSADNGMALYPYAGSDNSGLPGQLILGGPVGINTATPAAQLQVTGNGIISFDPNIDTSELSVTTLLLGPRPDQYPAANVHFQMDADHKALVEYNAGVEPPVLGFGVYNEGWPTTEFGFYHMVITQYGNVGIGTDTPTAKLDVNGNLNFTGTLFQNGTPFTSGAGWAASGSNAVFGSGNVGIGTASPAARQQITSITEQLRVGYDASNYYSTTVGSTGGVTFNATGSNAAFTFSDGVNVSGNLNVAGNGGVLFTGTVGVGAIPAQGVGTRFMWYPGKGALRAGSSVDTWIGESWSDANIGVHSVAFGTRTVASGSGSTALSEGVSELSDGSVAMSSGYTGWSTVSVAMNGGGIWYGDRCTAMNLGSNIWSSYNSSAINEGVVDSSNNVVAMSGGSTWSSGYSTAMSGGMISYGNYSTAINGGYTDGGYAFAVGQGASAHAFNSSAFGRFNVVEGDTGSWVETDPLFVVGNGTGDSNDPPEIQNRNAFTIYKNGDVKIAKRLDINGDLNFTGTLFQNGSPFTSGGGWAASGSNAIFGSGNVGIGTSDPQVALHVNGEARIISPLGGVYFGTNPLYSAPLAVIGNAPLLGVSTDIADFYDTTGAGIAIQTDLSGTNGIIQAQHPGVSYLPMLINPFGGNVGIGTDSPAAKLEVNGDFKVTGAVTMPRQGDILMGEFGNPE